MAAGGLGKGWAGAQRARRKKKHLVGFAHKLNYFSLAVQNKENLK